MIQINILAHNSERGEYTKKSIEFLSKIKEENKSKIKFIISFSRSYNPGYLEQFKNILNSTGIEFLFLESNGPYMEKIYHFIESECKYSCSMDEDIMINTFLWDYLIENIEILDDEKNLFLTPLISNGVPSTDMFIEDFCNSEEKEELEKIFCEDEIPNMWGVDYTSLNYEKDKWDSKIFFERIMEINHPYKGIHPMRMSSRAQSKLAEIICNNTDKFLNQKEFSIEKTKFPYFCNSFFFIKTEIWKKIVLDNSLYIDPFDEVPLNLYRQLKDLNMVFVRKGFCVHMAYNTINNQSEVERYFYSNLLNKI